MSAKIKCRECGADIDILVAAKDPGYDDMTLEGLLAHITNLSDVLKELNECHRIA